MPLIQANHTQLWVERFGDPKLPPVLLLHGLFFSGEMYAAQLPLLTPHFHCVTIDWRSMGRSPLALGGHDVDTGSDAGAKASPDGYTLTLGSSSGYRVTSGDAKSKHRPLSDLR